MTVKEALTLCDDLKPNSYETATKVRWLSEIEMLIRDEIFASHVPSDISAGQAVLPLDDRTPMDTPLAVPTPYDGVYPYYLHMMIDRSNGDVTHYDRSAAAFAAAFNSFAAYYNRTVLPLQSGQQITLLRR